MTEIFNLTLAMGGLVALISGVLRGYTGFVGGLLMIPLLAILLGPLEGITVSAIAGFVGAIQMAPRAAKIAHWPELAPVSIALAITTPLGILFLVSADPILIRRAMGAFVLLSAIVMMTGWNYRGSRAVVASATVGALAGGVTGAFGIPGGPFFVLYFLAAQIMLIVMGGAVLIF